VPGLERIVITGLLEIWPADVEIPDHLRQLIELAAPAARLSTRLASIGGAVNGSLDATKKDGRESCERLPPIADNPPLDATREMQSADIDPGALSLQGSEASTLQWYDPDLDDWIRGFDASETQY
jgi:hypothetical protein